MKRTIIAVVIGFFAMGAMAQTAQEALEAAKKANTYFMDKYPDPGQPSVVKIARQSNLWTRAVYYEGLMALNEVEPNEAYMKYVDAWGTAHQWNPRNNKPTVDADNQCCFQTYIMRYRQVGGEEKLAKIKQCFAFQMGRGTNRDWTWIDAIQMAMPAYAMYAKTTGQKEFLDYAVRSYLWARDTLANGLFDKANGLWFRDKNFVEPYKEKDGKNCYWSRGNGWVYASLCRTMNELTPKQKEYKMFKNDFILMSQALVKCQREDGFWNPSLVSQDFACKELTGTSLFAYGLAWGINNGILKKKAYLPALQKAVKAMLESIHNDGFLGYIQGSGDRPASSQPVFYDREPDFDDFGLGCYLLGLTEYYKLAR